MRPLKTQSILNNNESKDPQEPGSDARSTRASAGSRGFAASVQQSLSSEDQLRGIIEKLQEMALTRTDIAYLELACKCLVMIWDDRPDLRPKPRPDARSQPKATTKTQAS